jgi:hypothetical protein
MRQALLASSVLVALTVTNLALAEVSLLLNDSFVDNGSVGFQTGFAAGESAGVTLGPVSDTFTIQKLQFLFGPTDPMMRTLNVKVIVEDSPGVLGATLYQGDYQITPASDALQVIDLTTMNVTHAGAGSIRVAVQVNHTGAPGVARDDDGCQPGRNWIYTSNMWNDSCALGLMGDWVMRAEIDGPPLGTGGAGGMGVGGATTTSTTSAGGATTSGTGGASGGAGGAGDIAPEGGCNCVMAPRTLSDIWIWGSLAAVTTIAARRRSRIRH